MNISAKFDELQEQCQRFHIVLKTITTWLDVTEETLVSMAPVGVDPDVLGKQISDDKVCC
jgi:hypothetical protein